MKNYQNFKIYITFLILWMSVQFGQLVEDMIAYFLVLTFGIIHGANDLLILKRKELKPSRFYKSLVYYSLLIVICIGFFVVNSYISLLLFIVLSSYHFGEQHLEEKIKAPYFITFFIFIFYGLIIFSIIFLENLSEVDKIVLDLTGSVFSKEVITISLVFSSVATVLLMAYCYIKKYFRNINFIKEIFYVILLALVFKACSLMLGFAVYFILWHSIPSILDQTKYLSGKTSKFDILNYFKSAGPIWILSLAGLTTTYYLVDEKFFDSVIFLILFAITLPHVWVMYRMKN